jgi:DNA processing protein
VTFPLTSTHARMALGELADATHDADAVAERYATVVWSHLVEPGDSGAGRLTQAHGWRGALEVVTGRSATEALSDSELREGRRRWMPRLDAAAVSQSLQRAARAGVTIVTRADAAWPAQLDDLGPHAPHCLWVRGETSLLTTLRPSVSIVGARAATTYGEYVAMEFAGELSNAGVPVISGGAYGIDGAAHRAALSAGGLTVALLAGGVERAYPAGHSGLIDRLAMAGVVASEVPCGSAPTKWRFLQRNRLIAALADATVVVEAGWRSGSLNTAGHAASLGRPLGAVPGPITSAASAGAHRLMRDYGAACITSSADILELIGLPPDEATRPKAARQAGGQGDDDRPATDDRSRVRDALSTRVAREAGDVARRAGMSVGHVESILGLMGLEGSAIRTDTGWRMATK